jgi:predicted acylesterase/phospholipase RssA
MKTRRLVLLPLLIFSMLATSASGQERDACKEKESLPFVLNVGLPRMPKAPGFDANLLKDNVFKLLKDFYAKHGRCPDKRALQINVTMASDYEILDWLSQDRIQAAVVPDMTLFLLTERDELDLRKVEVQDRRKDVGSLLFPALMGRRVSGQAFPDGWRRRDTPQADLKAFYSQAWREASGETPASGPRYRIVLASHLSTPGFLDPVLATANWLQQRLKILKGDKAAVKERFWKAFFDHARFAIDCDSMDKVPKPGARSCWEPPISEARPGPIEIVYPGESALREELAGSPWARPAGGTGFREHFVIAGAKADEIFKPDELKRAIPTYRRELLALFGERSADSPPMPAFESMLDPEPLLGVRTFGFTVDEILRLLRQDQRTSPPGLALVLPGGGVKAVYQSRIVDDLYGKGYLRNFAAKARSGEDPLEVQYVIGTSGGALLGYFVSQLGPGGPPDLTGILWKRGPATPRQPEGDLRLGSPDVFGWTDLLRYLSVVVCFLVLCSLLALASVPEQAPFNPAAGAASPSFRGWLTVAVVPLFLAAPFLVRWSNGEVASLEQVPQFEGLVYAILTVLVMFADQCLVKEKEPRAEARIWVQPLFPVVLGGVLIAAPFLGPGGKLADRLTFWPAFAVLAPLVLFCGLILPLRIHSSQGGRRLRGAALLGLELAVPIGAALLVCHEAGDALSRWTMPFYILGFGILFVLVLANTFLRAARTVDRDWKWWTGYGVSLVLTALLVMRLCLPEQTPEGKGSPYFAETLEISTGTFLLCVGLLLLLAGGVSWVYASRSRYHLQKTRDFLGGLLVVLAHLVLVSLVLWLLTVYTDLVSPLELTGEFWLWLLGISFVFGLLILLPSLYGKKSNPLVHRARRGILFLCSHHPNGDFVTRRFLRLALLSVFSLVWWNAILAPALYGNGQATTYLRKTVTHFQKQSGKPVYRPSARFIAPANLLETNGTRYFLFAPDGKDLPVLPRRPSGGGLWCVYFTRSAATPLRAGCPEMPADAEKRQGFLRGVIFASGSPFPIFPAHHLSLGEKDVELVDGGYSNNVPVDAALTVEMKQVLIVESTNPVPREPLKSEFGKALLWMQGKLVKNLGRLPQFVFENSQQIDRLSSRNLFVASIAPSRDELDWPPLFDFRHKTVNKMEQVAKDDLHRRVGMVKSWGVPEFPLNVRIPVQKTGKSAS